MFQETIANGSREVVISANDLEGPFTSRLYLNNGTTAGSTVKKAATLKGARKQANKILSDYVKSLSR